MRHIFGALVFVAGAVIGPVAAPGAAAVAPPGLALALSAPAEVVVGAPFTATAVVRNDAAVATGGPVRLSLLFSIRPDSAAGDGWQCADPAAVFIGYLVSCTAPAAPSGATLSPVSVGLTAPRTNAVSISGVAADDTQAVAQSIASIFTSILRPILVLEMQPPALHLARGASGSATIVLRNAGTLPSALASVSVTGTGFASFTATPPLPLVLLPAQQTQFTANFTGATTNSVGRIDATVEGPGAIESDGDLHAVVLVGDHPDLELSGTGPLTVAEGAPVTYGVSMRNIGTLAAPGPIIVEIATSGLDDPRVTASGWTCNPVDPDEASLVECRRGSALAAGATAPLVTVLGTAGGTYPDAIDITATIIDGADPNDSNDTIDLSSEYPEPPPPPPPGDSLPPSGLGVSVGSGAVTLSPTVVAVWQASDPSGVARYDVEYRRLKYSNGKQPPWLALKSATTLTQASIKAAPGESACVRMRATDGVGNQSAWSAPTCTAVPLKASQLRASSGWSLVKIPGVYGGQVRRTTSLGAALTRPGVYAQGITLVATHCQTCGVVRVRSNGATLATIWLYSPTVKRSVTHWIATPGGGPLTIAVDSATVGLPVEVEGLAVHRG